MNFVKTTEIFESCNGRTANTCYFYLPASGKPRAVVQLSHGMCEYVERYEHLADFLCGRDIALIGHDHPGHGRSAPDAGELGFIDEKNGADLMTADLRRMHLIIRERFPEIPVFLLGHSMGSFVARDYLSRWADGLSGAIICGTAGPNPAAAAGIRLANGMIRRKGSHYRSELLNSIAFGAYNKPFGPDLPTSYEWISSDRELVDRYAADPLCTYIFTAAGFRDLFTSLERVSRPEWARSVPAGLPLYIIAGEQDPVGDFGKGVRRVASRLIEAGTRDLTLRLYPGDRHEIFNEQDRETVFAELAGWLESRIR